MNKAIMTFKITGIIALFFVFTTSCTGVSKKEKGEELYQMQCARCHVAPDINDLPKEFWTDYILPEMAARMGIKDEKFEKYIDEYIRLKKSHKKDWESTHREKILGEWIDNELKK